MCEKKKFLSIFFVSHYVEFCQSNTTYKTLDLEGFFLIAFFSRFNNLFSLKKFEKTVIFVQIYKNRPKKCIF